MVKSSVKIILSAAVSIDGKIATSKGDSKLSSKKDLIRLHKIRSKVDAIIIGKNTVASDDPLLTVRLSKGKNPTRVILDSNGAISKNSQILQTCNHVHTIIAVSRNADKHNLGNLKKFPIEIIKTGEKSVNLKSLIKELDKRKIKTILVEGGGTVNWQFIKQDLFDEIIITVSPFVVGGKNSVSFVQGNGFDKLTKSPKLKLKSTKKLGNHVVLHYIKI